MKLNHLTLHDYRTYAGRQTIDLSTKSPERPIVLIGGLNGAGKTTLLDALQLALFGSRANLASRGSKSYKAYLREAIHRNSDPNGGAWVELGFSHAAEGKERHYVVRRSWYPTGSGVSERVEVEVDGVHDPVLTDHWEERVDDFVPHRISNLFFFDGEEIKELQAEDTAADILRTAIHSLLGLDLVDRLVSDLDILDRKKRREADTDVDQGASEAATEERDRIASDIEEAIEQRACLLKSFDKEETARKKAHDAYKEEGGELADNRTTLEAEGAQLDDQRENRRAELRELALGAQPLLLIQPSLSQLEESTAKVLEAQNTEAVDKVLAERDHWILGLFQETLEAGSLETLREKLASDREGRRQTLGSGAIDFGLDPDQARELARLVAVELPAIHERGEALKAEIADLSESIALIERRISEIPERETVEKLREAKEAAETASKETEIKLAAKDMELIRLKERLAAATERLRRALESELAQFKEGDGERRKLERAKEATEILEAFRARVLRDNIARVEVAVLESFQDLVRKPGLVSSLSIDPETFEVQLINDRGRRVQRDDLSAGEKQLLAISILWGLAKTAGIPMPVVVDTPLGRLDSTHRVKLIEHYFPRASHQVLLLSTDEEIRTQRLEDLEPYISRSYLLAYDDVQDRTVVDEGYFQHQA